MSIRNNEDRLGAKNLGGDSPIPQAQQGSTPPTFSFVTPTEFVELPSKGKFYPKDHPLHNVDTVEIKHMTAKEEDILTSRSLLKKGLAVDRLLQSVIVDKRISPDTLLIGDKNAIILMTRILAYGADYETRVACPGCLEATNHSFNLNDPSIIHNESFENGVSKEGGTFTITLPKTKVKVGVRLLTGKDEKFLVEAAAMKRKNKLPEAGLTDQFRTFITSVNGVTDRETINGFINNMPASDSRFLRTAYEKIVPNIDMRQNFTCDSCGYEDKMEVPLSADFFWPGQ